MEPIANGILKLMIAGVVALIPLAFFGLIIAILVDAFKDVCNDLFGR